MRDQHVRALYIDAGALMTVGDHAHTNQYKCVHKDILLSEEEAMQEHMTASMCIQTQYMQEDFCARIHYQCARIRILCGRIAAV